MGRVTFVGACGTVTGSSTLLEVAGARILVDCGLFQGDEEVEARNRAPFPFPPSSIDTVLLTHAHLDHVGLLPRLVAEGFSGPVYLTPSTRPLAALVLEDSAELQEESARYARKKGFSRHAEPTPLYTTRDAKRTIELFQPVRFHEPLELRPGLVARFWRAGHLLGAASVEVAAKDAGGERRRWLFSGDIGRYGAPILHDPEPPADAPDVLLLESTYGDRNHPDEPTGELLGEVIGRTFGRGGSVIIPAFALGRTQDLLYELASLSEKGIVDPQTVFIDSPMAIRATEIYRQATPEHDEEFQAMASRRMNPLAVDRFRRARTVEESKAINARPEPAIIVASSGMANGGRVVHHLAHRLPDPRTSVVFVGYQAEGTRGRALLDGAETISIHGRPVAVGAEIIKLSGLSAHAGRDELLRWTGALPGQPSRIFLNHGEDAARKALAAALAEGGPVRPVVPMAGESYPW